MTVLRKMRADEVALRKARMLIGGKWVDSASGKVLEVEDPAHRRPIAEVRRGGAEDVALVQDEEWKTSCDPSPPIAAELIESIVPNEFGWFFPSAKDPSKPVSAGTLYSFMWRQRDRGVIPVVTNRDLRRTWK